MTMVLHRYYKIYHQAHSCTWTLFSALTLHKIYHPFQPTLYLLPLESRIYPRGPILVFYLANITFTRKIIQNFLPVTVDEWT